MSTLDVAGAVAAHLRADTEVMTFFDGHVYADRVPGSEAPGLFAVVRADTSRWLVPGAPNWDTVSVLIDVLGDPDDVPTVHAGAGMLRDRLDALRGVTTGGVLIQAVEAGDGLFSFDPTFTPSLPRWVLTAQMVVRNVNEGAAAWH